MAPRTSGHPFHKKKPRGVLTPGMAQVMEGPPSNQQTKKSIEWVDLGSKMLCVALSNKIRLHAKFVELNKIVSFAY